MSIHDFVKLWDLMTKSASAETISVDTEEQAVTTLLSGKDVLINQNLSTAMLRALYEGKDGAIYTKGDKVFAIVGEDSSGSAFVVRNTDGSFQVFSFGSVLDELVEGEKVWFWDSMEARINGYLDA